MIGIPGSHAENLERAGRQHNHAADVIVVGAGPAGSTAAMLLAAAGHDVLLLDRARFPRAKPCGDCLSAAATRVLQRLGMLERVQALPHARLLGWRIVAPAGADFSARFADVPLRDDVAPDCALAVERALLDAALLDGAIAAGARFTAGVRVTDLLHDDAGGICGVAAGARQFRARLVIGADGLRSVVAQRLGAVRRRPRLRKLSLTAHVDARLLDDADLGEMHCGDGICVGLAPLRADGSRFNVTVVADARRFGRLAATDTAALVQHALAMMPRVDPVAGLALSRVQLRASGPFDRPTRRIVFDGAALVGDAAGYYDPFTGQGVYQALTGAVTLARVADRALRRGDCSARALAGYQRRHRRALRAPRFVQKGIEAVLSRPRLADRAIARIARAPAAATTLIGVTGDLLPPARLLSPQAVLSLLVRA